jgi:hypothetical protein
MLDATGTSATNTGSVRLQSTELWGPLVSSTSGGLVMNVQTINNWPVSNYDFSGNGANAAETPSPASFSVNTAAVPAPAIPAGVVAGDPLWVDGLVAPFGSAPPDFNAYTVNAEASVPASLQVLWVNSGTTISAMQAMTWGLSASGPKASI